MILWLSCFKMTVGCRAVQTQHVLSLARGCLRLKPQENAGPELALCAHLGLQNATSQEGPVLTALIDRGIGKTTFTIQTVV